MLLVEENECCVNVRHSNSHDIHNIVGLCANAAQSLDSFDPFWVARQSQAASCSLEDPLWVLTQVAWPRLLRLHVFPLYLSILKDDFPPGGQTDTGEEDKWGKQQG